MILRCTAPSLLVVAGDRRSSRANPVSAQPATLTVFLSAIGSKDAPPGVVDDRHGDRFTTLTAVHRDTANIGRRIRIAVLSTAAVAVVLLSWRVPEPESPRPASTRPIDNVSYLECAPQFTAAPNYGTRSLGNSCTR
jgi:hypothetical protein